ncbi:hypothetical protein WV31_19285 [Magnetospirillum sp. ME-1]|nr:MULTISPECIES: hypothetical protein [Magnetospirillum]ARJ67643.1 hypothetical protein WV31_19285 [Magnetospirillum sp. ME-1]
MKAREIIDADAWLARKKERRGETISDERRQLMAMIYSDATLEREQVELERAKLELGQIKAEIIKIRAEAVKNLSSANTDAVNVTKLQ